MGKQDSYSDNTIETSKAKRLNRRNKVSQKKARASRQAGWYRSKRERENGQRDAARLFRVFNPTDNS